MVKKVLKVLGIFIIFEVLIQTLCGSVASGLYNSLLYGKYAVYAVSEFVVFVLTLIFLKFFKKTNLFKDAKVSFGDSLTCCMPILILSVVMFLANFSSINLRSVNINNLISLGIYCVLIGLFEEVFFRGLITGSLLDEAKDKKTSCVAIVIGGLIFGLAHSTNLLVGQDIITTMSQVIQASAIGILFGTVYYLTRNIWSLVFLHSFYDFGALLSSVDMLNECGYVSNAPVSVGIISLISSIILSLIYLLYCCYLLNKKHAKTYKIGIVISVILFFGASIIMNIFFEDTTKYYKCLNYEDKELSFVETHYYSYTDFYYNEYHIYLEDNSVYINEEKLNIDNALKLAVIDNSLLVISYNLGTYYLDYINIDSRDILEFEVPAITGLGYLKSEDIIYPMVKSYTSDIFIIDNNTLYKVDID